jgi:lantibiotic modifying enzyme
MTSNTYLETAASIAAGLCRDAIWEGRRANWLGDMMEFVLGSWQVVHRSFAAELYGGTSGIGLFLARAWQATGEGVFRQTAEGAAAQALSRWDEAPPAARVGYYAGSVGIADALCQIGEAVDRQDLVEQALHTLVRHLDVEPGPYMIDVIGGVAGAIPPLLKLASRYSRPELRERAIQFGDHLLKRANRNQRHWSWTTMEPAAAGTPGQPDLTGFSHGTAGVVWALAELHKATGRAELVEGVRQGLQYEQFWYQADIENWPDFRAQTIPQPDGTLRHSCSMAWCHGAPGIALGRLRVAALTGDATIRQQAEAALRSTSRGLAVSMPGQESFCLCHGAGGNAESLIYAAEALNQAAWLDLARQTGDRGIEMYQRADRPWPCGVTGGGANPSLLIGLAGIGYFYLRLYDPARFRSVLIVPQD